MKNKKKWVNPKNLLNPDLKEKIKIAQKEYEFELRRNAENFKHGARVMINRGIIKSLVGFHGNANPDWSSGWVLVKHFQDFKYKNDYGLREFMDKLISWAVYNNALEMENSFYTSTLRHFIFGGTMKKLGKWKKVPAPDYLEYGKIYIQKNNYKKGYLMYFLRDKR